LSTPFQNRLVGTIIVAAAIIIFLPDVLDGEKESHQAEFDAIPPKPAFIANTEGQPNFPQEKVNRLIRAEISDEKALDDDFEMETVVEYDNDVKIMPTKKAFVEGQTINNNSQVQVNTQHKTDANKNTVNGKEKSKAVVKTKTPAKAVPKKAWVIQLGSFRNKPNVNELLAKLKKAGYATFTRPIKTKHGTLTKVFIGPELIESSLTKKLPELKALTKIQGKIARYQANQ
jgi:DedD protein